MRETPRGTGARADPVPMAAFQALCVSPPCLPLLMHFSVCIKKWREGNVYIIAIWSPSGFLTLHTEKYASCLVFAVAGHHDHHGGHRCHHLLAHGVTRGLQSWLLVSTLSPYPNHVSHAASTRSSRYEDVL